MIKHLIKFVAFSVLTLGLTAWIGLRIAQYDRTDRYQVAATFDDVTGLFVGDEVKLAGVKVGQVSSIGIEDGRARVQFRVNDSVDLPVDSRVAVRWRNLIGQRFLYLYEGTADELLPTDGTAVVDNATRVTDITDLVNTLGPLFTSIDPQQLNDLFTTLVEALDGNVDNLDSLLVDLNTVVRTLAERDATIQQLLGDYATITGELATRDQQISAMVDNLVLLSQVFADNTALVDRALVELSAFSTGLDTLLTTNETRLANILTNLGTITDTATARLDELEGALQNLPAAVTRLFDVINDGEFLNINVPCLSVTPPPCTGVGPPLPDVAAGSAAPASASPRADTVEPLDDAAALSDLLLGSLGGQPR